MRLALALVVTLTCGAAGFAQCPKSCPTEDEIAVQALLDAAAAAGGGVVQLEPRVYQICQPLFVGSNTHLRGAGRGVTIIRGSTEPVRPKVNGSSPRASIAAVGVSNVTISDLTVDHATCKRNAHGIAFVAANGPEGFPLVTDSIVERVEVRGSPSLHSYMIWNFRGQRIKFVNNWIDGGTSPNGPSGPQEGIESYGGSDVLIAGNSIRNIGYACLNVGSGPTKTSGISGVRVMGNHVSNCEVGVNLGAHTTPEGVPQNQEDTRVIGNTILNARKAGIDVAVSRGTVERDLLIQGNTIRDIKGNGVVGIHLRPVEGTLQSSSVVANTIANNHIENIRGTNAHAIRLVGYFNTRILDNTITGTDGGGVYAVDSSGLEIAGNRFNDAGQSPIQLWGNTEAGFERFVVERNWLHWSGPSAGVLVVGGKTGAVRDNVMMRTAAPFPAPVTTTKSCGVTVTGNLAWYEPGWVEESTPACP